MITQSLEYLKKEVAEFRVDIRDIREIRVDIREMQRNHHKMLY
jgi:hypothetical protein